jgi:hypothetical protein
MKLPLLKKIIAESLKAIECRCYYYSSSRIQKMSEQLTSEAVSVVEASSKVSHTTFETLKFDNLVLRTLPIDPITENYVREVKNACFSQVSVIHILFKINFKMNFDN